MDYPDLNGKSRDDVVALLDEWITSASLKRHCLAVETAMRAYADNFGENVDAWGMVGLIHDFDYERHPSADQHPVEGARVLTSDGYPEWLIDAVLSHADYLDVPRDTRLKQALYAVDELSGFVAAVALVRPSRRVADVKVSSVKKKLKDRRFAEAIDRSAIVEGAEALEVELDQHIEMVIQALVGNAAALGLEGSDDSET
ncbi:MAG: HDIG domain-containing protein [Chloroflexota bacterium]|nr:HDIG domain-containing protein [Chloroflexota bacterium]